MFAVMKVVLALVLVVLLGAVDAVPVGSATSDATHKNVMCLCSGEVSNRVVCYERLDCSNHLLVISTCISECGSLEDVIEAGCIGTCSASENVLVEEPTHLAKDTCIGRKLRSSASSCQCLEGCHTCSLKYGVPFECSLCKNEQYLHNGHCVPKCPAGFAGIGRGNFRRKCVPETTTTTTQAPTTTTSSFVYEGVCASGKGLRGEPCKCGDGCHTCRSSIKHGSRCVICKNSKYLLDGVCLDSCPDTHIPEGMGRFQRRCAEKQLSFVGLCVASIDFKGNKCECDGQCHTCSSGDRHSASTVCELCKNRHYLLNGDCLRECPSGYSSLGQGNFNRRCLELH